MGHAGVGQGGVGGEVGHVGVEWGGSCRVRVGWVIQGGVGWVKVGWGRSWRGGSCRGGWVNVMWGGSSC